jgi:putative SOS response-associated peptidase YedK
MCGRYTLIRLNDVLEKFPWIERSPPDFAPRYNVAPSLDLPIVRTNHEGKQGTALARWGFVPSWTKGKPKLQPINAKSETVATSGMFRRAMERRRCLVPADGFYEWRPSRQSSPISSA